MKDLLDRIEKLETMVKIYSDRDRLRLARLDSELKELNMQVLELMTEENSNVRKM